MAADRFYSAEKYARLLDFSPDTYHVSHKAALQALETSLVDEEEWDALAQQADIDPCTPQHESTTEGIGFWDVQIPGYVLLARDKRGKYFAVTTWESETFERVAELIDAR